ncbi:MAG: sigma-70 family RNA polymerase sigma factor [Clostridia bacterium]|nr:sigma-70 family RNA polymerase sigma factor [Clostridia bacterium]
MEDARIIELFFERSEQAITGLSEKYGSVCLKVAENILNSRSDAEECVNDAYLAVWNSVPPEKPQKLLSYVCRIVRNLALKRYRANTARKRNGFYDVALEELGDCFASRSGVESELESAEVSRSIDSFLESLDKESRVLFVRRYWYSDPTEELAKLFGVSAHTVTMRLSRLRKKLKKHLEREGVTF